MSNSVMSSTIDPSIAIDPSIGPPIVPLILDATPLKPPPLDEYQQSAIDAFKSGKSVFITGPAGSGKSYVVNKILEDVDSSSLIICAPTWVAANNIGGMSIHKAFGVPIGIEGRIEWDIPVDLGKKPEDGTEEVYVGSDSEAGPAEIVGAPILDKTVEAPILDKKPTMILSIKGKMPKINMTTLPSVIVIDEISMMNGDLFMYLDFFLRYVARTKSSPASVRSTKIKDSDVKELKRRSLRAFADTQLILVGDFSQLPPIDKDKSLVFRYVFDTPLWGSMIESTDSSKDSSHSKIMPIVLRTPHRTTELNLLRSLTKIRKGVRSDSMNLYLKSLVKTEEKAWEIFEARKDAIWLFPRRDECAKLNAARLAMIEGEEEISGCIDVDMFGHIMRYGEKPKSKKSSVEGHRSDTRFKDTLTHTTADNSNLHMISEFLPLKVGAKVIAVKTVYDRNPLYNGEVMTVSKILRMGPSMKLLHYAKVKASDVGKTELVYRTLSDSTDLSVMCMVECIKADGTTVIVRPYGEAVFHEGKIFHIRFNLPLLLGWAVTIHKSQGMTLPCAIVKVDRTFDSGMIYTALSRCRRGEDLIIIGSVPQFSDLDPRVVDYVNGLEHVKM
jgi:ATP-dependent DNA helicase PIF1